MYEGATLPAIQVYDSTSSSPALQVTTIASQGDLFINNQEMETTNEISTTNDTLLGDGAGQFITDGMDSTGIGTDSLQYGSPPDDTAVGYKTLTADYGGTNTAVGDYSLQLNTTGTVNTAVGDYSLQNNVSGGANNAFGWDSLNQNTTGYENEAIGSQTLQLNTTGYENVALGDNGLEDNTTGTDNIGIGGNAGFGVNGDGTDAETTGSGDIFLGFNSNSDSASQLNNATAIGVDSAVKVSNSIVLGCVNGIDGCGTQTDIGIGTDSPANLLSIGALTTASSSAEIAVSTNGAANSGIVVQAVASQTADLIQAQSSTGSVLFDVDAKGNYIAGGKTKYSTGTITQTGYTITGSGTTFTQAMNGGIIYYASGAEATVTYVNATSLTSSVSQTISSGQAYSIAYGGLVVSSSTTLLTMAINGHIITGNTNAATTTAAVQTGAGSTATCTLSGNDSAGLITIVSAGTGQAAGSQCIITFSSPFGAIARTVIAPTSDVSTIAPYYVVPSTTNFTVKFHAAPTAGVTYTFDYFNTQ